MKLLIHLYQIVSSLDGPLFVEQTFLWIYDSLMPVFPKTIETGRMEKGIAVCEAHLVIAGQQLDRHLE